MVGTHPSFTHVVVSFEGEDERKANKRDSLTLSGKSIPLDPIPTTITTTTTNTITTIAAPTPTPTNGTGMNLATLSSVPSVVNSPTTVETGFGYGSKQTIKANNGVSPVVNTPTATNGNNNNKTKMNQTNASKQYLSDSYQMGPGTKPPGHGSSIDNILKN